MRVEVQGIGLGLRRELYKELFAAPPPELAWLEIHPENYIQRGGTYQTMLARARSDYPLLTHGLSMGFGAIEPFDSDYLRAVRGLLTELRAPFHSDHLCFSAVQGQYVHELLPLPLSDEALEVCAQRITEAQEALGVPIAVEHISYYAMPRGSAWQEAEFIRELLSRTDAKLLLDVNNIYVNAHNHGFDPYAFLNRLPLDRVVQLHIAGHFVRDDGLRIDTHGEAICDEVFALFEYALSKLGRPVPVLLERDDNYPAFAELAGEIARLDQIYKRVLSAPKPADALPSGASP